VAALLLVVYRHVAANYPDLDLPFGLLGLDAGQAGVALFAGLSGYLALRSRRGLGSWLGRRALRILPAYWVMLVAAVLGNLAVGHKAADFKSVLLQFLGLSYLVPASKCLNVAAWFITLLLCCYGLAAFVLPQRNTARRLAVVSVFLGATVVLLGSHFHIGFFRQVLAFEAGMLFCLLGQREGAPWPRFMLPAALGGLLLLGLDTRYALVAALALQAQEILPFSRVPGWVSTVSKYSYEFFLLHGLFLVFFAHYVPVSWALSLPMFLFCTGVSSAALARLSGQVAGVGAPLAIAASGGLGSGEARRGSR
jgi:peptidoglycan/LPS O-acetylase OafA/YrhL